MTSLNTEQARLRSTRPVIDISEPDAESLRDGDDEIIGEEHKQGDALAVEASQPQGEPNPWAPIGWSPDLPPKVELAATSQRQSAAQPTTQQLLGKAVAAITSLQQCMATLAAMVHPKPPPIPATNPLPQPRRTGVQPTPALADLLTSPTTARKRFGH